MKGSLSDFTLQYELSAGLSKSVTRAGPWWELSAISLPLSFVTQRKTAAWSWKKTILLHVGPQILCPKCPKPPAPAPDPAGEGVHRGVYSI